jgi:ABC-type transporter Mla subunit MlaD
LVTGFDWSAFLDVAGGIGAFLVGLGVFIGMLALARTLRRVEKTLDTVDEQVAALGKPVSETLVHVGGIADTADQTIARLSGVVSSLEQVAGSLARTTKLTQEAVAPAIVNVGATIGGISAGLRRLVRGDGTKGTGESA